MARKSLLGNYDDNITTKYFILGRNHPRDIPGMIWLFKTFKTTYMRTPIKIWTEAEPLLDQLYTIGIGLNRKIDQRALTEEEKLQAVRKLSELSAALYRKESDFSQVLGDVARQINLYLLLANIFCILFIIGNIALYAILMISRLTTANNKLELINKEITDTNKELDTLVYSVSHDLRSPITSIQGLLHIVKDEQDTERLKEYMGLIGTTINKQDIFILEIIDFFKNKRSTLSFSNFSLKNLIEDILANNKFTPLAVHITILREIELDTVYTDALRLKMIINNLVSNAIKYSDEQKAQRTILIKTHQVQNYIVIEVADNGVGIDKRHIDKIYNMFFVTANANKGTGLGLYILKQNVEKLNGNVTVKSELSVGTKFTVSIPLTKDTCN